MHFLTPLLPVLTFLSFLLPTMAQAINNTNNLGSTPSQRHTITACQAQTIIKAAVANATALQIPENIAVVDPSGHLVAFLHMDNAYIGSIELSQKKARTAVLFNGIPTAALYDQVQPGGPLYAVEQTNGGLVVFGGGVPIYLDGYLIGGVGVSGGTVEQDLSVVNAGVLGLGAKTTPS